MNECEVQIHGCHDNATCTNTNGSFKCVCDPGYRGTGINCSGSGYIGNCTPNFGTFGTNRIDSYYKNISHTLWSWKTWLFHLSPIFLFNGANFSQISTNVLRLTTAIQIMVIEQMSKVHMNVRAMRVLAEMVQFAKVRK